MHSSILQSNDLESLAGDILFQQALAKTPYLQKQIFFDTSGILDMLRGLEGMFQGRGFNRNLYLSANTLVYALAYRNWLGPICTLAPHTDELVQKIHGDNHLLREAPSPNFGQLEVELWGNLQLQVHDLRSLGHSLNSETAWIDGLKRDSIDLFKSIYLRSERGFWKHRYKYLREKGILKFNPASSFGLKVFNDWPLFKEINNYLNRRRPKSHNNYIDALALCLLEIELLSFEQSLEDDRKLPIFFSDQELILELVKVFSKEKDETGRFLFSWKDDNDVWHPIVRGPNFFIIEGILQAIQEREQEDLLERFKKALDELLLFLRKEGHASGGGRRGAHVTNDFLARSEQTIFLEFFDRWWSSMGVDELREVVSAEVSASERQGLDEKIEHYIRQERQRLNEEFLKDSNRFRLIKKAWDELDDLESFINKEFGGPGEPLNVFKEIDPRFAFEEEVCNEVQGIVDRIFKAVKIKDRTDLESAKSEAITCLLMGLYEESDGEAAYQSRLNNLVKALAVFWIWEKFDLIDEICHQVREQFSSRIPPEDQYPHYSIALMHAAAIMLGSSKDHNEVLRILDCIKRKVEGNYQVEIGFSYIYFLLWDDVAGNFEFYEQIISRPFGLPEYARDYLKAAKDYAAEAMQWLLERRYDKNERNKLRRRQRHYYYALNNFIFFAMLMEPDQQAYRGLEEKAKELEGRCDDRDYWQVRFADTLARYFHRLAYIAECPQDFKRYLERAQYYNDKSIKDSRRDRPRYRQLQLDLKDLQHAGFSGGAGVGAI